MTNTHRLKGWNPGHEPEVEVIGASMTHAYVMIDDHAYSVPPAWLQPLWDNGIQSGSTEKD